MYVDSSFEWKFNQRSQYHTIIQFMEYQKEGAAGKIWQDIENFFLLVSFCFARTMTSWFNTQIQLDVTVILKKYSNNRYKKFNYKVKSKDLINYNRKCVTCTAPDTLPETPHMSIKIDQLIWLGEIPTIFISSIKAFARW